MGISSEIPGDLDPFGERVHRWAMGIGVHGFGGNYLVNGKASGIVTLELEPIGRAFVIGIPAKLRMLSVSLDEPEQFTADFGAQVG